MIDAEFFALLSRIAEAAIAGVTKMGQAAR